MSLKPPTIVLFDMDGTTVRHIDPRVLNVLEKLDDWIFKGANFLSKAFLNREKNTSPLQGIVNREKKRRFLVHRALHTFRRKPVDQIVEPCPGLEDVLIYLQSRNIPMALVSNGLGKGYGHDILAKFDLEKYFQATLFREDLRRSKPHPDPILQAAEALSTAPTKDDMIWYIGDRHKDVVATLAAQNYLPCPIQPLAYGLNAAIAILEKNVGPDHIIMNYPDFLPKLKKMLEKPAT